MGSALSKLTIRPIEPLDVPAVARLWTAFAAERNGGYPRTGPEDAEVVPALLMEIASGTVAHSVLLVAERAGQILGMMLADVVDRPMGQPRRVGFLQWQYVIPEARRGVVGWELYRAIRETLRKQSVEAFEMLVPMDTARRWARRGYQVRNFHLVRELP